MPTISTYRIRTRGRRSRPAFTIVEVVMAIFIIGTLASIAMPRFFAMIANRQLESAGRRIRVDLALAQHRARMTSRAITVTFASGTDSYELVGVPNIDHPNEPYIINLNQAPYDAAIVAAEFNADADVVFDGFGKPDSGGAVVLQVGSRQMTVAVDPASGRATALQGFIAVTDGPS